MNGDNPGQFHGMGPNQPFHGLQEELDLEYGLRPLHVSSYWPLLVIKSAFPNKQHLQGKTPFLPLKDDLRASE